LIDLFCGAGGMSRGFVDAGYVPVFAVDIDPWAVATYVENFGPHAVCQSIERIEFFPSADVVIGGPPCQGFSLLGKKLSDDPRNRLWQHYLRALEQVQPSAFVMENVPQLLGSEEYRLFREAAQDLGYRIEGRILNAADFGVPQTRKRAIVIGTSRAEPAFPTGNPRPPMTVADAIAGVPPVPTFDGRRFPPATEVKTMHQLHFSRSPTPYSLERYRAIPEGGNRWDLYRARPDLTPGCWIRKTKGGTDLMGRLWRDRPAFTIRTEFFKPEKGRYLHPTEDRPITHLEAALLQTFPMDFRWVGSKIEIAKQIGNAVPPRLAEALGRSLRPLVSSPTALADPSRTSPEGNGTPGAERPWAGAARR
jgi:DNA (cytosine-5)-methyltransferase 1